jgi:hypothetical protein
MEMSRRGRVKWELICDCPRRIDVTRPRSSLAKTGGSFLSSKSPQVNRQGIPLLQSCEITRCAISRSSRAQRTISPGAASCNPVRCTRRMSPGRMLGSILLPLTQTRALPDSCSTSPIKRQTTVWRVFAVCLTLENLLRSLPVELALLLRLADLAAGESGSLKDALKTKLRRAIGLLGFLLRPGSNPGLLSSRIG